MKFTISANGDFSALSVTFNGEAVALPTTDTVYEGVKYLTVGADAFCILDGKPITAKMTETSVPFAQIVIDHGTDPVGDTYAYAILPLTDAEGAKAFSEELPFEIIANDDTSITIKAGTYLQAVEFEGDYNFSDNYFTMLPGEEKTVEFEKFSDKASGVTVKSYTLFVK